MISKRCRSASGQLERRQPTKSKPSMMSCLRCTTSTWRQPPPRVQSRSRRTRLHWRRRESWPSPRRSSLSTTASSVSSTRAAAAGSRSRSSKSTTKCWRSMWSMPCPPSRALTRMTTGRSLKLNSNTPSTSSTAPTTRATCGARSCPAPRAQGLSGSSRMSSEPSNDWLTRSRSAVALVHWTQPCQLT